MALVIYRTALVAPIEFVTFEEVDVACGEGTEAENLRDAIGRHDGLFRSTFKHREPHRLRAHITKLERDLKQRPSGTDLDEVQRELDDSRDAANKVLAFANHYETKRSYDRLWRTVLASALTFVVGAGAFAWASSPPTTPTPTSVVIVSPTTTTTTATTTGSDQQP